jgi:hypothetical protein
MSRSRLNTSFVTPAKAGSGGRCDGQKEVSTLDPKLKPSLPAPVPAIHAFLFGVRKDVDARHKKLALGLAGGRARGAGHDDLWLH